MKEMTKQDLNRVSAMILSGVEWDENYQPKFAVDCFVDCESGDAVKVLWAGDYELSLWNPAEDWRHLGEIIEEYNIIIMPISRRLTDDFYSIDKSNTSWLACVPNFIWTGTYSTDANKLVDYDFKLKGDYYVKLEHADDNPKVAALNVLIKYSKYLSENQK